MNIQEKAHTSLAAKTKKQFPLFLTLREQKYEETAEMEPPHGFEPWTSCLPWKRIGTNECMV
ncbi:hypothetical protein LJC20_05045 [Eubacteriales bacterium OttesenSCG-928-M02]|nr:hypothetical protein [Eubacteriales bacterium OttesenSCG-928-M02]